MRAVAATLFLLLQPACLFAGPVADDNSDTLAGAQSQLQGQEFQAGALRHDYEAIVPPLPAHDALMPGAPNLQRLSPLSTSMPKWHLPIMSQHDYLSGGSTAYQKGSLPIEAGNPFDITQLLQQSAEYMAIRFLLDPGSNERNRRSEESESSGGWTNQPISPNAVGSGGGALRHRDDLGLQYFATAVESLGVTDSQRQMVQRAVLDLKKYISVAQPNSQDMILQNQSGHRSVTIHFNSGQTQYRDSSKGYSDATFDDAPLTPIDDSKGTAAEYVQIFSISNIWHFMTSSTMIVLYVLLLALWGAWRYAIRRYI